MSGYRDFLSRTCPSYRRRRARAFGPFTMWSLIRAPGAGWIDPPRGACLACDFFEIMPCTPSESPQGLGGHWVSLPAAWHLLLLSSFSPERTRRAHVCLRSLGSSCPLRRGVDLVMEGHESRAVGDAEVHPMFPRSRRTSPLSLVAAGAIVEDGEPRLVVEEPRHSGAARPRGNL